MHFGQFGGIQEKKPPEKFLDFQFNTFYYKTQSRGLHLMNKPRRTMTLICIQEIVDNWT